MHILGSAYEILFYQILFSQIYSTTEFDSPNAFVNPLKNVSTSQVSFISGSNIVLKTSADGITSLDLSSTFPTFASNNLPKQQVHPTNDLIPSRENIASTETKVNNVDYVDYADYLEPKPFVDPFLPVSSEETISYDNVPSQNDFFVYDYEPISFKPNPFEILSTTFDNKTCNPAIFNNNKYSLGLNLENTKHSIFDSINNGSDNDEEPNLKKTKSEITKDSDLFKDFAALAFNEFKRDIVAVEK